METTWTLRHLSVRLRPTQDASMALFLGLLGACNLVFFAPVVLLLGFSSLAAFTGRAALLVVLKGVFDNVLSEYLWGRAVLLIGPTIATVRLLRGSGRLCNGGETA
jgi:solute carrier family 35, member F5